MFKTRRNYSEGGLVQNPLAEEQQALLEENLKSPETVASQAEVAETVITPDQLIDTSVGQAQPTQEAQASTPTDTATVNTEIEQTPTALVEATTVSDQVAQVAEGVQPVSAQPSPKATVQGQLETLMQDFEGGGTPAWASGAMRQAMGIMQSRGLGASSIAGQAVVQAAMESATAIASADAQIHAGFEMKNLDNAQQTSIFKTQQTIAGLFSDQAAENAASNINASSKNQMTQFFSNLEMEATKFNAAQINGMAQFQAGEENAISKFNATLKAQREQFNAANSLVISQANAQWRQQVSTAATVAQNLSNMEYTKSVNSFTSAQLDQIWQRERDLLDFAFTASESALDRASAVLLAKLGNESSKEALQLQADLEADKAKGALLGQVVGGFLGLI